MLRRWDPFREMERFPHRMLGQQEGRGWVQPAVDVYERDDRFELCAELAGLKPEDVHLDVTDDVLTLSGERKLDNESERDGYRRVERSYGRFSRSFTLPRNVDGNAIEASMKNGVLTIHLPKTKEQERRREIGIRAEDEGSSDDRSASQPREQIQANA